MARTSPGWLAPATICSQNASIEPPAKAVGVPGQGTERRSHLADHRQLVLDHPQLVEGLLVPPAPDVEVAEGRGRGCVDGRDAGQGMGGHRLAVPVAERPRVLADSPAHHASPLAPAPLPGHAGRHVRRRVPSAAVAVEEAREQGPAPAVDGGDRGDHRRDHHPGGRAVELGGHGGEGPTGAPAPGQGHVVLEELGGRGAHPVGHPGPRQHGAAGVHGHRFDRRGTHVNADGAP